MNQKIFVCVHFWPASRKTKTNKHCRLATFPIDELQSDKTILEVAIWHTV